MISTSHSRVRVRVVQVFAGALGAKGLLMAAEVPLSFALDWWDYAGWMSIANVVIAVLAIVGLVGLARISRDDTVRVLVHSAILATVVALGAWVAWLLVAHDVLFVGFSTRRIMHGVGTVGFVVMLVCAANAIARMTPGLQETRVHQLLRWGMSLVVVGGALALLVSLLISGRTAGPTVFLEVVGHVLFAIGLLCMALAALHASKDATLRREVVDAFQ